MNIIFDILNFIVYIIKKRQYTRTIFIHDTTIKLRLYVIQYYYNTKLLRKTYNMKFKRNTKLLRKTSSFSK